MKRKLGYGLLGLFTILIIAGIIFWPKVNRLLRVNSLFDEGKIVHNFSNMEDILFSTRIERTGEPTEFPVNLSPLPETYSHDREDRSVQAWLEETDTTSLLVLKDGEIVFEEYYLGTDQEDLRISWSMAKSFLSALFGIYVDSGDIDLNAPITQYVPELNGSAYEGVPVKDILQMSSGVSFNEDYMDRDSDINRMGRALAFGRSMGDFAASLKERDRPSGEARHYVSIDTHVLAMALENVTGKSLQQLLDEHLWSQMGPEGDAVYLTDKEGVAFALGGLNMQTRDYARFGELFRLGGNWNGQQLIPEWWVRESVLPSANPATASYDELGYGYQWWVPVASDGEFNAGGIYGQYIYVNPKAGVTIVKTSADRKFQDPEEGSIPRKLETTEMFRAIAEHYSDWEEPPHRFNYAIRADLLAARDLPREDCEAMGGVWTSENMVTRPSQRTLTLSNDHFCNVPMPDAGYRCESAVDCKSWSCVAGENTTEDNPVGVCPAYLEPTADQTRIEPYGLETARASAGMFPAKQALLDDVAAAREAWTDAGIDSYKVTIAQDCFCAPGPEAAGPNQVLVDDGRVQALVYLGEDREWVSAGDELLSGSSPDDRASLMGFTIDELFDAIAADVALMTEDDRIELEFHPRYGFPTLWSYDDPGIVDEQFTYTLSDFAVVD